MAEIAEILNSHRNHGNHRNAALQQTVLSGGKISVVSVISV
jgi:hypothetical protein